MANKYCLSHTTVDTFQSAEECSAPCPSYPCGSIKTTPFWSFHLSSAEDKYWSIMICAPLIKSPNCFQIVSVFGDASAYPYSNPITPNSDNSELYISNEPWSFEILFNGINSFSVFSVFNIACRQKMSLYVLTRNSNIIILIQQGSICKQFSNCPINFIIFEKHIISIIH